jgi:hypothetical protein
MRETIIQVKCLIISQDLAPNMQTLEMKLLQILKMKSSSKMEKPNASECLVNKPMKSNTIDIA